MQQYARNMPMYSNLAEFSLYNLIMSEIFFLEIKE